PPIDVAVPMAPEATPTPNVVPGVTGTVTTRRLMTTAASTAPPRSTASASPDTAATTTAPSTVPGSRPIISQATPDRCTRCRSRHAMPTASGTTSNVSVAGSASGSTRARTGTAMRLAPNPTEPCTAAPRAMAARTTAYSAPLRWMGASLCRPLPAHVSAASLRHELRVAVEQRENLVTSPGRHVEHGLGDTEAVVVVELAVVGDRRERHDLEGARVPARLLDDRAQLRESRR